MLLIWGYTCHNWELLGMWSWTPAFLAACLALDGVNGGQCRRLRGLHYGVVSFCGPSGLVFHGDPLGPHGPRPDPAGPGGREHGLLVRSSAGSAGWPLVLVIGIGLVYAFTALGDSPILSAALTERWTLLTWAPPSVSDRWWGSAPRRWRRWPSGWCWTGPTPGRRRAEGLRGLGLGLQRPRGGGAGAVWAAWRFGRVRPAVIAPTRGPADSEPRQAPR